MKFRQLQERPRKFCYICLCCRKIALHIAKVFFACPCRKSRQFSETKDTVVNAPPVYDYVDWWPSCHCVLHIERVWSTIVYFCFTQSRAFGRIYENGSTPLFVILLFQAQSRLESTKRWNNQRPNFPALFRPSIRLPKCRKSS